MVEFLSDLHVIRQGNSPLWISGLGEAETGAGEYEFIIVVLVT
jgi:hypothetical protein